MGSGERGSDESDRFLLLGTCVHSLFEESSMLSRDELGFVASGVILFVICCLFRRPACIFAFLFLLLFLFEDCDMFISGRGRVSPFGGDNATCVI